MCNVSSCTTLTVCYNRPLLQSGCLYIYLQLTLNVIQQASLCLQTRLSVLIFTSAVRPTTFQAVPRAQRRRTATLQVKLRVLCCVGAGIVQCFKGWRCVGGVEVYGARDGGVGRGGGVWWEGWRCVVEVEVYGGRCGGVWEGWRYMVGGVEVCGRDGGVWWEGWRCMVGGV